MVNEPHKVVQYSFRELVSLVGRLGEKIKDRYIWENREVDEAQSFLIYFRDALKKQKEKKEIYQQIFGESGTCFSVKPFKRGYNAKSVVFKTIVGSDVKQWVLKIGHRISPVIDYGDPSTPVYFKQIQQYLALLRAQTHTHDLLAGLIPEPQEIMWGVLHFEDRELQSTLMIQPFLQIVSQKQLQNNVTKTQAEQLLAELNEFKRLCEYLILHHKLRPDLLGDGNLSVAKIGDTYHLVLLDIGLVNMQAPIPITQTFMHFASLQTFAKMERVLLGIKN